MTNQTTTPVLDLGKPIHQNFFNELNSKADPANESLPEPKVPENTLPEQEVFISSTILPKVKPILRPVKKREKSKQKVLGRHLPTGLKLESLELIGEGAQGIVYRVNNSECIKFYKDLKYAERELKILLKARKKTRLFPQIHRWGKGYMIREYIEGINLDQYLQSHRLTKAISRQLVGLIKDFKKLGFKRLDTRLDNVIITPQGTLRPIDPTSAMLYRQTYPKIMLNHLKRLGLKKRFLKDLKNIDRKLYMKWKP